MGGSYTPIFETKNYQWLVYENHSDTYRTYKLVVFRKKDDTEIERRTSGSWGDKEFREFDEAFNELEKETDQNYRYKAFTDEQIMVSEMWKRMTEAESSLKNYKRKYEELEKIFRKIDDFKRKLERA